MKDYSHKVEEADNKQSRINAAGLINATLEKLWGEAYYAMSKDDFLTWNRKLDAIWMILGGDEKKDSDAEKSYKEIETLLIKQGKLGSMMVGFKQVGTDQVNRNMQYLVLKEKSIFLRRLQNKQGKGTAYHDDDEDDWD